MTTRAKVVLAVAAIAAVGASLFGVHVYRSKYDPSYTYGWISGTGMFGWAERTVSDSSDHKVCERQFILASNKVHGVLHRDYMDEWQKRGTTEAEWAKRWDAAYAVELPRYQPYTVRKVGEYNEVRRRADGRLVAKVAWGKPHVEL